MRAFEKGLSVRCALCVLAGAALAFVTRGDHAGWVLTSDLAFGAGMAVMVYGLCALLSNLRMFASFAWGTRLFKRLVTGEKRKAASDAEDYFAYRNAKAKSPYAVPMLALAAALLLLSAALALL